jgi:hypothetical protein
VRLIEASLQPLEQAARTAGLELFGRRAHIQNDLSSYRYVVKSHDASQNAKNAMERQPHEASAAPHLSRSTSSGGHSTFASLVARMQNSVVVQINYVHASQASVHGPMFCGCLFHTEV